jgi:DNA-binding response OmpR family regulator
MTATDDHCGDAVIARADLFGGLRGKTILIVEPDGFAADYIGTFLKQVGAHVIGPLGQLTAANEALKQSSPAAAVIEVSALEGEDPGVLSQLAERSARLLILADAGDRVRGLPAGTHVLRRPFGAHQVAECLTSLLSSES